MSKSKANIEKLKQRFAALLDSSDVDFGDWKKMTKDCWLFLTDDSMPGKATIKKAAFMHEVGAMIEIAALHQQELCKQQTTRLTTTLSLIRPLAFADHSSVEYNMEEVRKILNNVK